MFDRYAIYNLVGLDYPRTSRETQKDILPSEFKGLILTPYKPSVLGFLVNVESILNVIDDKYTSSAEDLSKLEGDECNVFDLLNSSVLSAKSNVSEIRRVYEEYGG